jgi:hypothetical protein
MTFGMAMSRSQDVWIFFGAALRFFAYPIILLKWVSLPLL